MKTLADNYASRGSASSKVVRRSRSWMSLVSLLFLTGFLLFHVGQVTPLTWVWPGTEDLFDVRWTDHDDWHKYVRAPPSRTVYPKAVLDGYTTGNVSNPDALLSGDGSLSLSRSKDDDKVPSLVFDFGQNLAGVVSIDFLDSVNGSEGYPGLRLAYSETLQFLSDRSDFSRSDNGQTITPGTDQIAVRPGSYSWTSQLGCQNASSSQVCSDGLHGFRYLRLSLDALSSDAPYASPHGRVVISALSVRLSGYHGVPSTFAGRFACSDPALTQWWYDSVYTNDLCTDVFRLNDTEPRGAGSPSLDGKWVLHDGAKRDRDPYLGDLAVAALTTYLTRPAPVFEAARNVLEDLAAHQRADGWIPPASIMNYTLPLIDYPLWWVICGHDYVLYSGNVSYARAHHRHTAALLDGFYPRMADPATKLLFKGWPGSATEGYGDYAFLPRQGRVTYYSALYVLALDAAANMADQVGGLDREADARRWRARAAEVGDALPRWNWDPVVGAFFDGSCGDEMCDTHAQDGNSLAVLAGAVPLSVPSVPPATAAKSQQQQPHQQRRRHHHHHHRHELIPPSAPALLAHLSSGPSGALPYGHGFYTNGLLSSSFPTRVYPFVSYFEVLARFATPGFSATALAQVRRTWGWMAAHDPGVTAWEGIGEGGQPYEGGFTSMAHGWSTGIVPLLVNEVLGVRPTGAGWSAWRVKPRGGWDDGVHGWRGADVPKTAGQEGRPVRWARGTVPAGRWGSLEVAWKSFVRPSDDLGGRSYWGRAWMAELLGRRRLFELTVRAPEGTAGVVEVPVWGACAGSRVVLNGDVVYDARAEEAVNRATRGADGYVALQVGAGEHVIVVEL